MSQPENGKGPEDPAIESMMPTRPTESTEQSKGKMASWIRLLRYLETQALKRSHLVERQCYC